jgi:hypothetical protein
MRLHLLIATTAVLCSSHATGRSAASPASDVNLAVVATPTCSYVSGDTRTSALNDGVSPRSSRDDRRGTYGNWPRQGTQWVQYDWTQPISTARIEVYWWDDARGVRLPKASRVKYWDGKDFIPVPNPTGLDIEANRFNVTTFDEITTSKLRLEMDGDGEFSTGIIEWRVLDSGRSPRFPPRVAAGVDRTTVLGGQTYLSGQVQSLKPADTPLTLTWTKQAGPGRVTFANPNAADTAAGFDQPGDYVLALTADEGGASASATLKVRVEPPPPTHRLDVVHTKRYKIDSPLWNSRARSLIVNWIPHCIDYINRTNLTQGQGGIDNFVEAAKALRGEAHAPHKGYVFANAWVHQTVESICIALMVDPQGDYDVIEAQQAMRATLEDWIPKILAAQEPDGYLQTAYTLADRSAWPERWSPRNRGDHEGYVAGYFIESAINHHTLTEGKDLRLYDAAKRLADCWVANIGPGKKDWYDGHQEMEQALVRFGRFVNDVEGNGRGDAYIKLAKFLLDCRNNGSEYDQSHLPVQRQYEAVGHAVRAVYSYSGMADVAAETADVDYQSAVLSLWDNMVNRKYYVTGGIDSGETSEGFGPDYSLPHSAYCESCSSCGLIFFQHKLNLAYHDARYADLYEETIYNALLGAVDLEGKTFNYTNPLIGGRRTPWHACPCCVGNIPRTLLMIPTWTYLKTADAIHVNLFIGGTITLERVAGTDVEIVQKTDYPWDGKVALTVNPREPATFAIHVRVPDRQTSALYTNTPAVRGLKSFFLNGQPASPRIEKGYAVVKRAWKAADTIELELPMEVQRIVSDERVFANRGFTALRYGPLIYCVERADQPVITGAIGPQPLATEWRGDFLHGVKVIKGTWDDGSPLLAIPYYARDNRPDTASSRRRAESQVWIKTAPTDQQTATIGNNALSDETTAASSQPATASKQAEATSAPPWSGSELLAVPPISIETITGTLPRLPRNIAGQFRDGTTGTVVRVIWPSPTNNQSVLEPGTFTVTGRVAGTTIEPKAVVTVKPASSDSPAPTRGVEAFPLDRVSLDRDEQQRETPFIRHRNKFIQGLAQTDPDRFLYMFRDAFGQPQPETAQPLGVWDSQTSRLRGHASGHYLSAIAQACASTGYDPALQTNFLSKLTYLIDTLYDLSQKSGRPTREAGPCNADPTAVPPGPGVTNYNSNLTSEGIRTDYWNWGLGFISAYPPDQFIMLEQGASYGDGNHQVWAPYYTLHKILAGCLDCYEVTRNQKALEIARGMGLWVQQRLQAVPPAIRIRMWNRYIAGEYGGMNEVMARLFRLTGDVRFLDCARLFDNSNFFFGDADHTHGLARNVDTLRGRHANQHIPQITGALEIYRNTGERPYLSVAEHFWGICTGGYMYSIGGVAGACNPNNAECFTAEPDSLFANGFNRGGQNETCATYNLLKLSRQLFMYDPDARYMDYYEQALYNHILASVAAEDSANTYHVPLNPAARKQFGNGGMDGFTCCNGTALESATKLQDSIYFHGADHQTLFVNLFIPSTLRWTERNLTLTQRTSYPFEETTRLVLAGNGAFDLKVRVPRWATRGFHVCINGQSKQVNAIPGSYLNLGRDWKDKDTIELHAPFPFHLSRVMDQPNIASLFYGPILLAAEESGPRSDWRPVVLDAADIGKSITGNPRTLRFDIGGVMFRPFFEMYGRHSVYLDVRLRPETSLRGPSPTRLFP